MYPIFNYSNYKEISYSMSDSPVLMQPTCEPNTLHITSSHTVLRQIREVLVELCIAVARVFFFWVPGGDVAKGQALMVCHPLLALLLLILFFTANAKSPLRILIAFLVLFAAATQWLFKGCVITRAEQRLTGSKETILDPFLKLAGICVNRDTLGAATVAFGSSCAAILVIAVVCDMIA